MKRSITIKRHKTARGLVCMWYELSAGKTKNRDGYELGYVDSDGRVGKLSFSEHVEAVEKMGIWGFSDTKRRVIHFWHKLRPNTRTHRILVEFFSHETGHLIGKPYKRLLREEARADEYMMVSRFAYDSASRYYGGK